MLEHFLSYFTQEHLTELFQSYRAFGPLIAVLLPLVEAFLPFLPLIVFVVANTNSFGLWKDSSCLGRDQLLDLFSCF